jgi:hypothetical protein
MAERENKISLIDKDKRSRQLFKSVRSKLCTICGASPLYLYPNIRLSFKGNQFYFRIIRKLKIEELPAI